jgi:AcrR family transcriptional regulator
VPIDDGRLDSRGLTTQFNRMVKPKGSARGASKKVVAGGTPGGARPSGSARRGASTPAPTTPGASDGDTRERILAAAHRVFVQQGTSKARTQEIADEAGVNKALVHYYFGTKEALADAVFAAAASTFLPRVFALLGDESLSLEAKVRGVVREQLDFHLSRPYLAAYVVTEAHTQSDRVQAVMRRAGTLPLGVLRRQLNAAAAAGEIRRISAEQFVVSLMGLLVFPFLVRPVLEVIIGLDAERFPAFIDARKRDLAAFFLAGLRP